jgi:hypothetical protein
VTQPLSRAELLELPPVINLVTLGRALGLSEPVVRERARKGEFAALGIRVLHLGAQYRIPTADVLRFLGIDDAEPQPKWRRPDRQTSGRNSGTSSRSRPDHAIRQEGHLEAG